MPRPQRNRTLGQPSLAALLALWALTAGPPLHCQFTDPRRVTPPDQVTGSFDVGLDFFENFVVAHEEGGRISVETLGGNFSDHAAIGDGIEPRVAFSLLGSFLACSWPSPGASEHKIVVRSRTGAAWSQPYIHSLGAGDDRAAAIAVTGRGELSAVWERRTAGKATRIWFRRDGGPEVDLGPGEAPTISIEGSGRAHLFFLRDGDVFYAKESSIEPGSFAQPINLTHTPTVNESAPRSAVHDRRRIFVCFEQEGKVLLADDRAGDLSKTAIVALDGSSAAIAISPNGALAIVFEGGGDLMATLGATFFLPPPLRVLSSPEEESRPSVAVDSFANTFVAFLRGGALYWTSNAGIPQAKFEPDPPRGEAPLIVAFADQSSGDVTGWVWELGDGSTSTERNPVHTYESSGEYRVRLRVIGPGGESPIAHERAVLVSDPRNEMHLGDVAAFPGQESVYVPVIATHDRATQGFTIAAVYDPQVIRVREVVYEDTNLNGIGPELFAVSISDDPAEPFVTAGILFDVTDPFDGRVFPPGQNQRIANIIVDLSPFAKVGSETLMELKNEVGRPPLNNIFTVDGFTVLPLLGEPGKVHVRRLRFPPPRFFRRGDADSNGTVNLTDGITVLNYLFAGGANPACYDAADVTDDGSLDVSDATFLLNFLFKSGSYPAPPFPDWGLDPTDDELPECMLR